MATVIGSDDYALPVRAVVKKGVRTRSTSARLTFPERLERLERLWSLRDEKPKTMPIILEYVDEKEVEGYMKENGESLPFRWHYHSASRKFFIDELNDAIHECVIVEVSRQLGNEAIQYNNIEASGADTCFGPSAYGKTIQPDACIRYRKKVPSKHRDNAADSRGRYYPSVIVEVGYSQKKESLKDKIDAWFAAGNEFTGVRCVVEINIDYPQFPPAFVKYRLICRGKKWPNYKTIKSENVGNGKSHPIVITAVDFFHPAPPPNNNAIIIDVEAAYAKALNLTRLESDEEDDDEDDDEDNNEDDDEDDEDDEDSGEHAMKRARK